jgi:hypothetical protein
MNKCQCTADINEEHASWCPMTPKSKSQYKRLVAQGAIDPLRIEKLERLAVVTAKYRRLCEEQVVNLLTHFGLSELENEIDNLLNELAEKIGKE